MGQCVVHATSISNSSKSSPSRSNCRLCPCNGLIRHLKESMRTQLDDVCSAVFWKCFLAEIIGTFFLVFFIVGSLMHDPHKGDGPSLLHVALLSGFFIATIITVFLHVSGGHVNPAISIGFLVTRHISLIRFLSYVTAQLLGAVAGAYTLKVLCPHTIHATMHTIKPDSGMSDLQAVLMEFIVTFFLLFAVFSMIDHSRKDVSGSIPLGIGIVVVIEILAFGNKSGCLMNPALNFGPAVVTGEWDEQWIYWLGDMLGAVAGTLTYVKIFSAKSSDTCHLRSCCLGIQSTTHSDEGDPSSFEDTVPKSAGQICTSPPITNENERREIDIDKNNFGFHSSLVFKDLIDLPYPKSM